MSVFTDNLRQFVRKNFSKYAQTAQSYVFNCPQPNCGGKRKLYLRKKDGRFICFKCKDTNNYTGKAEKVLADLTAIPFKVIQSELYGTIDNGAPVLDIQLGALEEETEIQEIAIVSWPLDFYPIQHEFAKKGAAYLEARGVPVAIAAQYDIRYQPTSKRVFFPVYEGQDLCGWQGRLIYDDPILPKALTSKGLNKSAFLMFSNLIPPNPKYVILCEGPVDVIKTNLLQNEEGGAVATMGKGVSKAQIQKMLDLHPETVYLALDSDAYVEIRKLVKAFYGKVKLKIIQPLEGLDLGAMTFEQVKTAFDEAKDVDPNGIIAFLR